MRSFPPSVIPGLLQTREYAEGVFRGWIGDDPDALRDAAASEAHNARWVRDALAAAGGR